MIAIISEGATKPAIREGCEGYRRICPKIFKYLFAVLGIPLETCQWEWKHGFSILRSGKKMSNETIMDSNYNQMKSYIERSKFVYQETVEQNCKRLNVQSGKAKSVVKVYTTGTIQIQGAESKLKEALSEAKEAVENEVGIGEMLPFEIERFPELLKSNTPGIDPIIVRFIEEGIITIKAGSNVGCAFLLGGASEKAIYILMEAYSNAIADQKRRDQFISKTSKKPISKAFAEFKASWKSSINKPKGYGWTNDIEVKIEQIFQFCRICRNESGHPHLPPNLDKGVLLSNMGQFVKYIEDMYEMVDFYRHNNVEF